MSTIYDAYGEDGDMSYFSGSVGGGVIVTTSASSFRAGIARCALQFQGNNGPSCYGRRFWLSGTQSVAWFGARVVLAGTDYGNPNTLLGFVDAGGVLRLALQVQNGGQIGAAFNFYKVNAAGTLTLLFTTVGGFSTNPTTPDKVDMNFNYSPTGFATLYINGVSVGTYSGDVTTDGATALAGSVHSSWTNYGGTTAAWSECVLSDSDTRNMTVTTTAATGAGTTDSWSGAYTNVDGLTVNDSVFDTTTTAGAVQLYTMGGVSVGSQSILAVVTNIRAAQGSGSLAHLKLAQSIAGTQYLSAEEALPSAFGPVQFIQPMNPATGAAWLASDLNASNYQAGYQADA